MKIKKGDIFEIIFENNQVAYAQALEEPEYAFFEASPENESNEPLFRLWVHKGAIKDWNKIGHNEPSSILQDQVPRFKQDPINGKISIYISGIEKSATFEEITGLDRAAVWEGIHIHERLSDHYAGRENKWLKSLEPKYNG